MLAELPESYKLKIIGKGELENELFELANILKVQDRIDWLGELSLSKTLNQLNESAILLHPARVANDGNAEGTPQIILWAQALKIPVITSATGSISEIVKNELTGLLVESENIEQFIDAILKFNDESRRKYITQNGFEEVSKNHSLSIVVNQWLQLYGNLSKTND
ncbi:MAG: glycosyltransferase family 4 protein [Ignavibacteria bacterium]|nr:glycosyltransferase family 4 protein [Ignavibacteria bacterium]